MNTANKDTITGFIEEIWNQNRFDKMDKYIHADFTDHSLPPALAANVDGLQQWIIGTGISFEHKTVIEEMVCEEDKVMIKIKMLLKHIGVWRGIEPTGLEIFAIGYRYFKLAYNKIAEHWALIDGNAIENQLRNTAAGCKIKQ